MPDLLLELFSEEIPARMQGKAADDLKRMVTDGLVEAGLTYASAGAFATPRRLTLSVEGLTEMSPTTVEERRGPKVGAPEKALEGFLRGAGVAREDLEEREEKKGTFYFAKITTEGRPASDIIADVVPATIRNFPWPKSMRWGTRSLKWVRPLQSILCILTREDGAELVPFDVEGFVSANTTEGHRFMAPGRFAVTSFEDYATKLKAAKVELSAEERAAAIWHDATNMAFAAGLEVVEDKGLLAEVAGLVEWPVVLMGEIGVDFLDLPPEVLQTSMKEHQKFFSVRSPKTGRIERFITVANRETADEGATIIAGNAKVLAARLSDAKFFWENDLRVARAGMGDWIEGLKSVTFHRELGSQADQIARMAALSRVIAPLIGADADTSETAAKIAKADLNSEMVFEFPELQGVMGRYYAAEAGYSDEIAVVASDHYAPLGPSDDVPTAPISVAVALAEKLDKLAGFWAIDQKPKGSGDPFALRRAALGVIRIVLEQGVTLPLNTVLSLAFAGHDNEESTTIAGDLLSFFHDRLKVHLRSENIRYDVIDAVLSSDRVDDLTLVTARARALQSVMDTDDGTNLVQGYKRAANILAQAEAKDGVEYRYGADEKFAETDEERALFAALGDAKGSIKSALADDQFDAAMAEMAKLRAPIDAFFEAVQVNTDHDIIRRNRLNLLYDITQTVTQVADLSRIEG